MSSLVLKPTSPRDRAIIKALDRLKTARHFEDAADEQVALRELAALGVDEHGDDLDIGWGGYPGIRL